MGFVGRHTADRCRRECMVQFIRFVLIEIKAVQLLPTKLNGINQFSQALMQGFFAPQTEPHHHQRNRQGKDEDLENSEHAHALKIGEEDNHVGQNDKSPHHCDGLSTVRSLVNEEILDPGSVAHGHHLTVCDAPDFLERLVVKFGVCIPPHVLQTVGNAGFHNGVHSLQSVLKQQTAHQHRGQTKLPTTEIGHNDANQHNAHRGGNQALLHLHGRSLRIENTLSAFLFPSHVCGRWLLKVKVPLLQPTMHSLQQRYRSSCGQVRNPR